MRYKITRATIRFEDGTKDTLHGTINTDDIEVERKRIKSEYNAKTVEFRFFELEKTTEKPTENPPEPDRSRMSLDAIVANSFETTVDMMVKKGRKREGMDARRFAMWYRNRTSRDSLAKIGSYYSNRDHATVLHAIRTAKDLMQTDITFKEKAEKAYKILQAKAKLEEV